MSATITLLFFILAVSLAFGLNGAIEGEETAVNHFNGNNARYLAIARIRDGPRSCSGTLVSPSGLGVSSNYYYLVTAAHCVYNFQNKKWRSWNDRKIRFGILRSRKNPSVAVSHAFCGANDVYSATIPKDYPNGQSSSCTKGDIAVIQLKRQNQCILDSIQKFPIAIYSNQQNTFSVGGSGGGDTLYLKPHKRSLDPVFSQLDHLFIGHGKTRPGDSGGAVFNRHWPYSLLAITSAIIEIGSGEPLHCSVAITKDVKDRLSKMAKGDGLRQSMFVPGNAPKPTKPPKATKPPKENKDKDKKKKKKKEVPPAVVLVPDSVAWPVVLLLTLTLVAQLIFIAVRCCSRPHHPGRSKSLI